jgi:DNA (cytosine-5)-methyltransferase 1
VRLLDTFSGLAGFALAASQVWGEEFEILSFCEIDQRCRDFLSKTWPGVPIHDDIKTLDATKWFGTVDLLVGGPPCQPASRAGKQGGKEDNRWLWGEALRVLQECQPTWCLFENPPGIGDVGLDGILTEMERLGYEVQTVDIPACAVNSPQLRHRYWILAYLARNGQREKPETEWTHRKRIGKQVESCHMANTRNVRRDAGRHSEPERREGTGPCFEADGLRWSNYVWLPCADGKVRRAPGDTQRMAHGLPVELLTELGTEGRQTPEECEVHRSILGAVGNSIVWPVALEIMRAIRMADERK